MSSGGFRMFVSKFEIRREDDSYGNFARARKLNLDLVCVHTRVSLTTPVDMQTDRQTCLVVPFVSSLVPRDGWWPMDSWMDPQMRANSKGAKGLLRSRKHTIALINCGFDIDNGRIWYGWKIFPEQTKRNNPDFPIRTYCYYL